MSTDNQGYIVPQGRFERKFRATRRHIYGCADCPFQLGATCTRYSKLIPAWMTERPSQPQKPEWCAVIDIVINEDRYILDEAKAVRVVERKSG